MGVFPELGLHLRLQDWRKAVLFAAYRKVKN